MYNKYPSLENHYREKFINQIKNLHEVDNIRYQITEKVDGANFQIRFGKGVPFSLGKRSGPIKMDESFYGHRDVIHSMMDDLGKIQTFVDKNSIKSLIFYGEIFGPGIQSRVDYGNKKLIRFFDIGDDDNLYCPKEADVFIRSLDLFDLFVPVLGFTDSLDEALAFSCDFNSKLSEKENNPAEGIVIKPYEQLYYTSMGSLFYIKKKSEKFKEKMGVKKNKPQTPTLDVFWKNKFLEYINENRVLSALSKEGPVTEKSQIGKYIKMILDDAKEDFVKDNEAIPEEVDQKYVFGVGNNIFMLLDKHCEF